MQMNNDHSKRHHYYRNKVMFFKISFYVKFFLHAASNYGKFHNRKKYIWTAHPLNGFDFTKPYLYQGECRCKVLCTCKNHRILYSFGRGGLNIQRKAFVCVFFPFTFKDDQTNSWNTLYPRTLSQDPTLDERIVNMPYAGITRRDVFRPGPLN